MIYSLSLRFLRLFYLPYWQPLVRGLENVPRSGPLLLVCNHPTVLDGLILGSILPRRVRFLVSHEPFKIPLVSGWLRALGFLPVGGKSGALERVLENLRQGDCLGVYPEGIPTHSYELKSFRKGFALLAQWSGAPVVPVTIYGSEELFPEGCRWVEGGNVSLTFGQPLYWHNGEEPEQFVERVRSAIAAPLSNPPQLPPPSGWAHRALGLVWKPFSWAMLKLGDWARPGGKR